MRGSSKEPRFDFPLASSALVISEEGIPIDFYVYAGNASEFKTMATSIDSLKQKYDVKEDIVADDRCLNSAANLRMLEQRHRIPDGTESKQSGSKDNKSDVRS